MLSVASGFITLRRAAKYYLHSEKNQIRKAPADKTQSLELVRREMNQNGRGNGQKNDPQVEKPTGTFAFAALLTSEFRKTGSC